MSIPRPLLAGLLLLLPEIALAHTGHGIAGGLATGLLHPITGLDHLLAMVAVGLLAVRLGGRLLWALPLAFPLLMLLGAIAGAGVLGAGAVEAGILLSVVILGGLIARGRPLSEGLALGLVGVFALFHGQAHGVLMPVGDGLAYAAGLLGATAGLHALGIGLALALTRLDVAAWPRWVGGGIALSGVALLMVA